MTQGFYEQLGVVRGSSLRDVRSAYTRVAAQLQRRRRATVEQGGDTGQLDLARTQVDEAWEVLSDPVRRRKYDAMLAIADQGWTTRGDELWDRVSGALVPPATSTALNIVRALTQIPLGEPPPAPGSEPHREVDERVAEPTLIPHPDDERTITQHAPKPANTSSGEGPAIQMPGPSMGQQQGPPTAPDAPPPPPPAAHPALSAEGVQQLLDMHGFSGAFMRSIREARAMSLKHVGDQTRISVRYLEAIEADHYDRLPSATFVRGYVREMARVLELDDEAVVAGYMARFQG